MDATKIKEPTPEQCSAHAVVGETANRVALACWYPQMGGYVARAVVMFDKSPANGSRHNTCFDMLIWHDGEFPFNEEEGSPARLHHCEPQQFVDFGNFVKAAIEKA